jgi:hypothetical protein
MAIFDQASTALGTGMNVASAVNPAMMGLGMIPEAFKLGLGVTQALRARKIEKTQQRPIFNIPGAAQNAMAGQYNLASGQAPGLNTAMQQLAQAQAGSINAVQNSGGGGAERLAALTMLDQNAGNQAQQLGATQQQWQAEQQANLINQQNRYADWQQRAWEYNKYKPYEQAMAKAAELRNAANTNIYGAAKSTGGLISSALKGSQPAGIAQKAASGMVGGGLAGLGKTVNDLAKDVAAEEAAKAPQTNPLTAPQFNPMTGSDDSEAINQAILDEKYANGAPKFNPNQGMETYDFNAIDKEMNPPAPKGPFPIGYDPKTGKINPVAGPPNYNPSPAAPNGPFPISDKSIQQDKLNARYNMLDRGINVAKTVGSLMPNISKGIGMASRALDMPPKADGNDYSKILIDALPNIVKKRLSSALKASPSTPPKSDQNDYSKMLLPQLPSALKKRNAPNLGDPKQESGTNGNSNIPTYKDWKVDNGVEVKFDPNKGAQDGYDFEDIAKEHFVKNTGKEAQTRDSLPSFDPKMTISQTSPAVEKKTNYGSGTDKLGRSYTYDAQGRYIYTGKDAHLNSKESMDYETAKKNAGGDFSKLPMRYKGKYLIDHADDFTQGYTKAEKDAWIKKIRDKYIP